MFQMHAMIVDGSEESVLQEFKMELDTIHYVYANPTKGLGMGGQYVREIASWYDEISKLSLQKGDFENAEKYLERALDYYCDPTLDYDDDTIDDAKNRMHNIVSNCIVGIYKGCHDIDIYGL